MPDPTVTITFDGRPVACRAGLSVAAALWEGGIKVLSHSHKFGRPRGLSCARGHCMSCLLRIDGVPNVRACRTTVREGMVVARQDAGAVYAPVLHKVLDAGGHLLPVGFYFKWFTRPAPLPRLFLDSLRPMTGVGRLPDDAAAARAAVPPARDLGRLPAVVIGAGAAGLEAARAETGEVLLCDDLPAPGGPRRAALARVADADADLLAALPPLARLRDRLEAAVYAVAEDPRVELRPDTRVVGAYQPDMLLLKDPDGLLLARADRIVWAGGAWDRAGGFANDDLPGLMGPRALYRLAAVQSLRLAGTRAVACGRGPDLWLAAALLHAAGARPTLVLAPGAEPDGAALAAAQRLGWPLHTDLSPERAVARDGALAQLAFAGAGGRVRVPVELAVICARAKPAHDVPYQLGADLVLDPDRGGFVPRDPDPPGSPLAVVGEAAGRAPESLCGEVAT